MVCGQPRFEDEERDTLLNPTLIVEVLSPSTEDYDRGRKFGHYRSIPSLQVYLLVRQDRAHVEVFTRRQDGRWVLWETDDLGATVGPSGDRSDARFGRRLRSGAGNRDLIAEALLCRLLGGPDRPADAGFDLGGDRLRPTRSPIDHHSFVIDDDVGGEARDLKGLIRDLAVLVEELRQTLALRQRIESGEARGPRILTAGTPLYPANGIPYYLRGTLPPETLALLHTPETAEHAAAIAADQLAAGADAIKLFVGSWVERGRVLPMSVDVARAAAKVAHDRGKLVFAHGSNVAGLEIALDAGVDVLAHALDDDRGFNESHVARMKAGNVAMIPTLKLFGGQDYTHYIQEEVRAYAEAGGQILFGTDVGYLTDYDPTEEYVLMAGAGLDWREILAALTTASAERFGEEARRGRIAPGMDADLVVLAADPAADVTAFAEVVSTFRQGAGSTGRRTEGHRWRPRRWPSYRPRRSTFRSRRRADRCC